MKSVFLMMLTLTLGSQAFGEDQTCAVFAQKAVRCYELGYLASEYDQRGENCGDLYYANFWEVNGSLNHTFISDLVAFNKSQSGSSYKCQNSFTNQQAETCTFELALNLGDESSFAKINHFSCQ